MKVPLSAELARQWHPTKNGAMLASDVSGGSRYKAWWLCNKGHEWEGLVSNREKTSKCPVCLNRLIIQGANDLQTTHPEILDEWSWDKNTLTPTSIHAGSSTKVWWNCDKGHAYQMSLLSRTKNKSGCLYCSNQKVLVGFNDLATTHPRILSEWDWGKNTILPTEILPGNNRYKASWICKQEKHQWKTTANGRTHKTTPTGCPACAGKTTILGKNDFASQRPELVSEWGEENVFLPTDVQLFSSKIVSWKCSKYGHGWKVSVAQRSSGMHCPVCANRVVLAGFNDIATIHPHLVDEWDWDNNNLAPTEVGAGSGIVIAWKCRKGHEWKVSPNQRTSHRTGCPVCSLHIYVSKPEKEIIDIINRLGFTTESSNRKILGKSLELDIYVAEKNLGIEFNGVYWHSENQGKNQKYHQAKYLAAQAAGLQLLQIWEDDWILRKPLVVRAIAHKLGVSHKLVDLYPELKESTEKIYARQTTPVNISVREAKLFLEKNHIQGFASGSYYLGLQDLENKIRAVLVLKKEKNNVLNIVRYATSGCVAGGFTKLLEQTVKLYSPNAFTAVADHCLSDGKLYESNGFVKDKEISPDYMYVVSNERKHKSDYSVDNFRGDPSLLWENGLTEKELAVLNNIPRIWDAGKTRYFLHVEN